MAQRGVGIIDLSGGETRVELSLSELARAWRIKPRGDEFTQALIDFFATAGSYDTLRSYTFSVLQFFTWLREQGPGLPTPDGVRRADAAEYDRWLREHDRGLTRERLAADPQRREDVVIYDALLRNPASTPQEVYRMVAGRVRLSPSDLEHRLRCLVRVRTLSRFPSLSDIRAGRVSIGVDAATAAQAGITWEPDPELFSYSVPQVEAPPDDRSSTVATRLGALASLWRFMSSGGENAGDEKPLLRHNIWIDPLRRAQYQAQGQKATSRARTSTTFPVFIRLFATTFKRFYPASNRQAAADAYFWGNPVTQASGRNTFADLRDRALLVFMAQTGARSREIRRLKRSDISGNPPVITLRGKRGKKRTIRLPPMVQVALGELSIKLRLMARHQERYYDGKSRARELLSPDAPLFPPIALWGANAQKVDGGVGRSAIAMMLRRRAEEAGIEVGSPEFARAHPHGVRHLFAKLAADSGTPMNRIQAMMGHGSLATTAIYVEERSPENLIAEGFAGPSPVAMPPERRVDAPRPRTKPRARPQQAHRIAAEPDVVEDVAEDVVEDVVEPATIVQPEMLPADVQRDIDKSIESIVGKRDKGALTDSEKERAEASCVRLASQSARMLCLIYLLHWGEKGNRARFQQAGEKKEQAPEPDFESMTSDESRAYHKARLAGSALRVADETGPISLAENKNVYVGKESGLPWWLGRTNNLKLAMPVMSARQIRGCATGRGALCEALEKLWDEWIERSPTKAEALLVWLQEAVHLSESVDAEMEERGDRWVGTGADWPATAGKAGRSGRLIREHDPEEIVVWMRAVGGALQLTHATAKEKEARPVENLDLPAWYKDDDPVQALPEEEREALLDWIAALTGQQITGGSFIFHPPEADWRASRKMVARVVGAFCLFNSQLDVLSNFSARGASAVTGIRKRKKDYFKLQGGADGDINKLIRAAESAWNEVRSQVREATRRTVLDFDAFAIDAKEGKGGPRKPKILEMIKELFGEAAAQDPAINVLADCAGFRAPKQGKLVKGGTGGARLGTTAPLLHDHKDFFLVGGRSIGHTKEFKEEFAAQHKLHSECVARRVAREMWAGKSPSTDTDATFLERREKLSNWIRDRRGIKIACSPAQERELGALRRSAENHPARLHGAFGEGSGVGEDDDGQQGFTLNPRRRRGARKMRQLLPSPVRLLMVI